MDQQDSLRPCPFCGGELELIPINYRINDNLVETRWYFTCNGCFIESRIGLSKEATIEHANGRRVYVKLMDAPVHSTYEVRPGIFKDISYCGNLVGVEEIS